MPELSRLTETEILALSGSALSKIDRLGERGITMVTFAEIEAMAALIDLTGAGFACLDAHNAAITAAANQKET